MVIAVAQEEDSPVNEEAISNVLSAGGTLYRRVGFNERLVSTLHGIISFTSLFSEKVTRVKSTNIPSLTLLFVQEPHTTNVIHNSQVRRLEGTLNS